MDHGERADELDRVTRPIDWRLKLILIGVPILLVGALLYQYSQIRPVDHSTPDSWPKPSPEMKRAVHADAKTVSGRAELDRILRGDEHVAAAYAGAKLAQQGGEGWMLVAEAYPQLDASLQDELIEHKFLRTYAIINGAASIAQGSEAARTGTYSILEAEPVHGFSSVPRGTFEALSQALMDRYQVAGGVERERIEPFFDSYFSFPRETLLAYLDHDNANFRSNALKRLRYAGRPRDIAVIRKRLSDPDERVRSLVAETERTITIRGEDPDDLPFETELGRPSVSRLPSTTGHP
jgi:hypothetical protein